MDLSQIKLVVTDLDGTLLNSNHKASPLFFEQFKLLKSHNILFVAASGRPYYSIIKKLNPIKNDTIIVAENGGIVVAQDKLLLSTPMDKKSLLDMESVINSNDQIHPIYCTKSKAYFSDTSSEDHIKALIEYYPKFSVIKSINDIKEDIIKIAIYNSEDSEKHIYPLFKKFETEYKIKISGKYFLDISDNLANKGHAIQMLQNTYNISADETLIFGDYNNDIEMLKLATYSFAMENAHENVLKIANYKTKSNDNYGVEFILEALIKSKS
ncbi:HAD family hydrolase [uncultured Algibacter sp.]|uniref:HAD family hydrolase n=1 Tax=uncultured Algibacter sp. TaxID=298659 RepID=UPI002637F898|nr:HAD family hydrolase [uncultured Algibacter sp.]